MKATLFYLFAILFTGTAFAQNMVHNPNFALYSSCPTDGSQIDSCTYWRNGNYGTSDYFNSCATGFIDVPQNFSGYQNSPVNAYVGFYTYATDSNVAPDYKEYIATTITPLQVGATYKVEITVSLSDSSLYATDGLGVFFSVSPYPKSTISTLHVTPQVNYSSYGIITDKINWVTLTANFVADSAYQNIIIGNFKHDSITNHSLCAYHCGFRSFDSDSFAYYYVDSVTVIRTSPELINTTITSPSATLSPNPFTESTVLHIADLPSGPASLHIFNAIGREVYKLENITAADTKISRDNLENGLYYYKLYHSQGIIANGKILIN